MGRQIDKGIKEGLLAGITQKQKDAVVKAMARIMEDSYRRGLQHGVLFHRLEGLSDSETFRLRHTPSLDLSPENKMGRINPRKTWCASQERLEIEYYADLNRMGLLEYWRNQAP